VILSLKDELQQRVCELEDERDALKAECGRLRDLRESEYRAMEETIVRLRRERDNLLAAAKAIDRNCDNPAADSYGDMVRLRNAIAACAPPASGGTGGQK